MKWVDIFSRGSANDADDRRYAETLRQYLAAEVVDRIPSVARRLADLEHTSRGKHGIFAEEVLEAIACANIHASVFHTIAAHLLFKRARLRGRDLAAFERLAKKLVDVPAVPQEVRDALAVVRGFLRSEQDAVDAAKRVVPYEQPLAPLWDLNRKKRHALVQEPPLRVARLLIAHGLSKRNACKVTANLLFAWDEKRFSHDPKRPWSGDDVRRRLERSKTAMTVPRAPRQN
jgi:hypothetical protein